MTNHDVVIDVSGVTKEFTIHSTSSLKERVIGLFTGHRATKFSAINDVSFQVKRGETVGLVGHNGSGKSTLLKLIGGIIDTSQGTVRSSGRIAALLELGAGFHPDLTGRENIFLNAAVLGMSKSETDLKMDSIIEFSGLEEQFIDTQVKFYSSGMYVRLAFAVAVHSDPDILLVDEVLAVGDEPFQAKCMAKIHEFQEAGKTILFVSHGAEQVSEVCSRVIVLNHGSMVFDGDVGLGIRKLRDTYEKAGVEERISDELPVAVTDVMVKIDGQSESPLAHMNSLIELTVRVEVRRPHKWITGFTLTNHVGQVIYLLNTKGMNAEMPSEIGRYDVTFTLPQTNFGSKRVMISAGVTDEYGIPFNNLHTHISFDVEGDPHGAGFVQFAPVLHFEKYELGD